MLLMHNLDVHRKTGVARRKISSFLSNLLQNEILYSSDSECEYRITTTVRRIAKIRPEIEAQNGSDEDAKSSNRITRSGAIATIKREASEVDRVETSCQDCEFVAETEQILEEHCTNEHEVSFLSEFGKENDDNASSDNDCSSQSDQPTKRVKSKKFSCDVCSKRFKQKAALAKHMKQHCRIEDGDDDERNDNISDNNDTDDSLDINSKTKSTGGFPCDVCGKVFYRPKCFATHMKKHDESIVEKRRTKSPKKKTHLCSFCGKSYPGSNHLKIHLRIHTGERPFKCVYCDKTFAIKKTWQDHTYSHTGEKPYSCPIENCGKRFTHSTGVRQHMQCCHSSEKQFQCPHCDKKCSKKTHLEDHIRSHTGERPYDCKYCGIKFRLTSTLRIHHRTHTGERPFVCKVCNRGFIKSYGLKQHMKSKRNCLPTSVPPTLPSEMEQEQLPPPQSIENTSTEEDVQFHQLLILPPHQVLS